MKVEDQNSPELKKLADLIEDLGVAMIPAIRSVAV